MKLAYFTSRYPAISHTFIMREILALRARGIEVETISQRTPADDEILSHDDRAERARTFYILPPKWGRLLSAHLRVLFTRPLRYIATLWFAQTTRPPGARVVLWHLFYFVESVLLWDELRRRQAGHVHVHFAGPSATLVMIASRLGELTYSMTVHGSTVFFDVQKAVLRQKVEHARFVFCISEFTRAQVAAQVAPEYWQKLRVVHCGVDTDNHRPSGESASRTSINVLCVTRLVPAKGVSLLIEAVARLQKELPELRCTLVGDGPDRDRLERLAIARGVADRIEFVGAVGQDHIQRYYHEADVFALPSFAEGVPVVLMEAMAHGVPVVGTAVGGVSELIEPDVTGLLVPAGDVSALTSALRRLCSDQDLRSALIANGRRKVVHEFNIADIAAQVGELFAELLGPAIAEDSAPVAALEVASSHA